MFACPEVWSILRQATPNCRLKMQESVKTERMISEVKSFWNTEACGTHFVEHAVDENDFFEKFRAYRYRTEWYTPYWCPLPKPGEIRCWRSEPAMALKA